MGAIFAIMRELNLSLFTFRYRGHMVDYTAAHCALHNVSFCQIQSGFMYSESCKKVLTQNVEILNLDTSIKIIKNFKSSPKIRTEIPKN